MNLGSYLRGSKPWLLGPAYVFGGARGRGSCSPRGRQEAEDGGSTQEGQSTQGHGPPGLLPLLQPHLHHSIQNLNAGG